MVREMLIEIKQALPGFNRFIGSWVCQDDLNILIDVGPASTADHLLQSLRSAGLDRVDYVLLTHIHLDHAGGLAGVLEKYPMAKVICHEKALRFLVEPSRLWAGSLEVLGKVAEAYGEPKPVPGANLIAHTQCPLKELKVIETPGHAIHHLSFVYNNRLFVGEAGGTFCLVNGEEYLRPATPPRFFLPVSLASIDRLLALENHRLCYGHFGAAEDSHRLLHRAREQLLGWKDIIHDEFRKGKEELINRCVDALLEKDPDLKAFRLMDQETQARERFFIGNSVKGFIGFLEESV